MHEKKAAAGLTFFTPGSAVACRADAGPTDGVAVGVVVALALPRAVVAPRARRAAVVAQASHLTRRTGALAGFVVAGGSRAAVADALTLHTEETLGAGLPEKRQAMNDSKMNASFIPFVKFESLYSASPVDPHLSSRLSCQRRTRSVNHNKEVAL